MYLQWDMEQESAGVSVKTGPQSSNLSNSRCVPISCSAPEPIAMGSLTHHGPHTLGDSAQFQCDRGHVLVQTSPLICGAAGQWSGDPPVCIPELCVGPGFVAGGKLMIGAWAHQPLSERSIEILRKHISLRTEAMADLQGSVLYPVGSELITECKSGYKLEGDSINVCQEEDTWRTSFARCAEVFCPSIENIDHGKIRVEGFKFGQSVHYECEMGYSIIGDYSRTCREEGSWSGSRPACQPVMCPEPASILHGSVSPDHSLEYGSVLTYECDTGYQLVGSSERVCGAAGSWSGQVPLCVNTNQTCLVPQLISSGYVTYDGNLEVGSRAWYDCHQQYELVGSEERTCLESGWSSGTPTCQPQSCLPLTSLMRGSVLGTDYSLGSSIQFQCEPGSKLEGATVITCTESLTWNHPPPVCVPVTCPPPPVLEHGTVRGSARRYGDSISHQCSRGLTLLGSRVRICTGAGEWSGLPPVCASITCPPLPQITNGRTDLDLRIPGEKVRFSCGLGWSLRGRNNITCGGDGEWKGDLPSCQPSSCYFHQVQTNATLLTELKTSYSVRSELLFACPDSLIMSGQQKLTCLPTGVWDSQPPVCLKPQCSKWAVENGIVFGMITTANGTEVNFSCDNGYYKISHSNVSCKQDRDWEGSVPVCSKYQCPELRPKSDATIRLKPGLEGSYMAEYSCGAQYRLEGESLLRCGADREWSSEPPDCVLASCPPVPDIPRMVLTHRKVPLGDTINFKCQTGFELVGDAFLKCSFNGDWMGKFPMCKPKRCKVSRKIRHGSMKLRPSSYRRSAWALGKEYFDLSRHSQLTVGDQLETTCDPGYEVQGNKLIECLPSTQLDSPPPKCRKKFCHKLENVENGYIVSGATFRGATVSYHCDTGYRLLGHNTRKCRRNKKWSGASPVCSIVQCSQPHDVAHGSVEFSRRQLEYGTVIRYSCHLGYEITGSRNRVCGEEDWEGSEPECVEVRCDVPRTPLHGQQELISLLVGGTVRYSCKHGYRLQGTTSLTCLANKTWSSSVPSCHKILCSSPDSIPHGKVTVTSLDYGSVISYQCEPQYELVGQQGMSCLHSGHWSAPPPSCVARHCPRLEIDNADVWGSTDLVTVSCHRGFVLRGASRLTCQTWLEWSHPQPECQPLTCDQPPNVEHAISHAQGFSYLHTANYSCLPGYEMRVRKRVVRILLTDLYQGSSLVRCGEKGRWTGQLPSCLPRSCDPLQAPQHSQLSFHSPSGHDQGYGSRAVIQCLPGFASQSVSLLTCEHDGVWRGTVYPCRPVRFSHLSAPNSISQIPCGVPPTPENGTVSVFIRESDSIAEYRCHKGHFLRGVGSVKCLPNLQWQFGT